MHSGEQKFTQQPKTVARREKIHPALKAGTQAWMKKHGAKFLGNCGRGFKKKCA